VSRVRLIGVRQLPAGKGKTLVLLTRNECGTVAAQCLLEGAERPIIDGRTVAGVLAVIDDALEVLLLARQGRATRQPGVGTKAAWGSRAPGIQ
jgi:hypothetical protein